jgi:hypothetical protein
MARNVRAKKGTGKKKILVKRRGPEPRLAPGITGELEHCKDSTGKKMVPVRSSIELFACSALRVGPN